MPNYHAKPFDIATSADAYYWEEELGYFNHEPPQQQAASKSPEYYGWGLQAEFRPPPDVLSYVMAHYREDEHNVHVHDPHHPRYVDLHPMYKWTFIQVCMAHFLWFRTPEGGAWINRFFGVEEIEPFSSAYAYAWCNTETQDIVPLEPVYHDDKLVDGLELRIFREWERCQDPPCSAANSQPMLEMQKTLAAFRNPYAKGLLEWSDDPAFFFWTSELIRNWMNEMRPNKDWPTRKPERITGWHWARMLEREKNVPFFEALSRVAAFSGKAEGLNGVHPTPTSRAYRIKDPSGGVYWCQGKNVRIYPLSDVARSKGVSDSQVESEYLCQSCRNVRPCVPHTKTYHRCCHCFSIELETEDRPTLYKCTYARECKTCVERIDTHSSYLKTVTKLNQPARTRPVPR